MCRVRTVSRSVIRCMPHGVPGTSTSASVELAGRPSGEEVDTDRPHQRLGEPVLDQGMVRRCGAGPASSHHGGGGAHARCQIPGVVVGACHDQPAYGPAPAASCAATTCVYHRRVTFPRPAGAAEPRH